MKDQFYKKVVVLGRVNKVGNQFNGIVFKKTNIFCCKDVASFFYSSIKKIKGFSIPLVKINIFFHQKLIPFKDVVYQVSVKRNSFKVENLYI